MKTFSTVEDYIEVMAGKRDITGSAAALLHPFLHGFTFAPIVSLARYDTEFLDSVSDATLGKQPLTDRQADLALKLIMKYQRQLAQKGIDVSPMLDPKYRMPLRQIDRTRKASLQDDKIILKFPYDSTLIQQLRDLLQMRQGFAHFDKPSKEWHIAPSEYNVNFVFAWASNNQFVIDDKLKNLMSEILEVESQPYEIKLQRDAQGGLFISNAQGSLLEYLEQNHISMTDADLFKLVDLAPVLGYSIDDSIVHELENKVGSDVLVFALNRVYELSGDSDQLSRVLRYAYLANRLPLVVFDSTPNSSRSLYQELVGADQVYDLGNNLVNDLCTVSQQVLFCARVPKSLDKIPLLITHNGLLAGAEKQSMFQSSEKIIYFEKKLHP